MKKEAPAYYTVEEIAAELKLHRDTITRRFRDEPGVLKFSNEGKRHVRVKTTLRIPAAVKERVLRRLAS